MHPSSVTAPFVAPAHIVNSLNCDKVCRDGRPTLSQIEMRQTVPQSPFSLVHTLSQRVVAVRKKYRKAEEKRNYTAYKCR
jgi:hypothetical protein